MDSRANPPSCQAKAPPTSGTWPTANRADLHPEGQVEEDLVERMAVAQYRLRRIARIEVGYFDLRLRFKSLPEEYNQDGLGDLLA